MTDLVVNSTPDYAPEGPPPRSTRTADDSFRLPPRLALIVYGIAAVPVMIGAAIGQVQYGLIVALAVALLACVPAGLRWLLPTMFAFLPFQQSIVPGSVNVGCSDVINACLLVTLVPRLGTVRVGPAVLPLIFYLLVSTLASVSDLGNADTAVSLARMGATTLVPLVVYSTLDRRGRPIGPCLTFYLLSTTLLACCVVTTFVTGGIDAAMYTLGLHKNAMGTTFAVGVVVSIAVVLLRVSPAALPVVFAILAANGLGLLLSLSRGGWIACASGLVLLLTLTRRFGLATAVAVPAAAALMLAWQFIPDDRKEYAADVGLTATTVQSRIQTISYVMDCFRGSPLIGVGVGLRKVAEPHNMIVLNLGETGMLGTLALAGAVAGGFYTVFRRPAGGRRQLASAESAVRTVGGAILLVTLAHGMFDVYWRRGVAAAGWASVGLASAMARRNSQPAKSLEVETNGPTTR